MFPGVLIMNQKPFTYNADGGSFNRTTGLFEPGSANNQTVNGTLLPIRQEVLRYDVNGAYSIDNYSFYTKSDLVKNATISGTEGTFTVQDTKSYSRFADYRHYIVRRAGVVNE